MAEISIADAKAHLRELVDRAEAGETIGIARRGGPVAQLTPLLGPRKPIDMAKTRDLTDSPRFSEVDAATLVHAVRDDGY